jgi:hypothetical protein
MSQRVTPLARHLASRLSGQRDAGRRAARASGRYPKMRARGLREGSLERLSL